MKARLIFVERKPSDAVSVERVFRQIAKDLPLDLYDIEFQQVPYGNGLFAVLKNLLFFRPRTADIYHITGDVQYIALRLPARNTIMTIHDMISLHRRSGFRRYVLKKLYFDLPLRKLKFVTTISQAVKDELIGEAGSKLDRLEVIENPLIEGFIPTSKKPFDVECPVILHLGTAENKNLTNLIAALTGIRCKLRIIGRLNANIVRRLDLGRIDYENIAGLDQSQIVNEYQNSDIVAFCSTYEGFGLPIIEAQAMLTPVATSDVPPMNAVAADGAALVDPYDVESIRSGILRLIEDAEYRKRVIEAGAENVKRFDRTEIALRYAAVYQAILETD